MKICLILPSVGRKVNNGYIKTWQMEPLSIAVIKSLTPKEVDVDFFDDRIEEIDYSAKYDLVALSVETYTAKRAYDIAEIFKKKGSKIIMGGFHPTLAPDDVMSHADSIVIGQVESLWKEILMDLANNSIKKIYQNHKSTILNGVLPDRTIYKNKRYLPLRLVETGRGCGLNCEFCSVTNFFNQAYISRPIEDVVFEIRQIQKEDNSKYYFFVDDNICSNIEHAKELFRALEPLKIRWISQASINITKDTELLRLMKLSGCEGILIGLESLNLQNLKSMHKQINLKLNLEESIKLIHSFGLRIYATFVFGYDSDSAESFKAAYDFAIRNRLYLTAFNHLVPFPGTPLYRRMEKEKRLLSKKWWLDKNFTFGDVVFKPKQLGPHELTNLCYKYRKKFYSSNSIFLRLFNTTNFKSVRSILLYLYVNFLMRKDVTKRQGLPFGGIKR